VEIHVRVVVNSCAQVPGLFVVDNTLITGAISHKSVVDGAPKTGEFGHSILVFAGQLMLGGVLS
jgi:LPXTG-motif cell wall-anchored protein